MKQKLFVFGFIVLLVVTLVGLNAASYTQKEKTPDNEITPNRSTFNSGATGMQAYYTLLAETGRSVARWQESPSELLNAKTNKPSVFIVAGTVRREFDELEVEKVLRWVSEGGRLVLIDREPPEGLAVTTSNWKVSVDNPSKFDSYGLDPSDQNQMTAKTDALKPVQPSVFTAGINAVQPSKIAATVNFGPLGDDDSHHQSSKTVEPPSEAAPTTLLAATSKNLLVEAQFGSGKIIFLSDPYIVSNGGIALADNAQLAVNLASSSGIVAFDEYHQGFGNDRNRFLQFFAGTPIVAIFLQAVIIVGFVFYSQSRRFGRPVPEPEPDRLTKLEYVAAMAELQNRTKAFDLAIENIYSEFRRRLARLFGLEVNQTTSRELAVRIAERTDLDRTAVENTLFKCEEIIRGEPTNRRQVVKLADELRNIERSVGISRMPRPGK